MNKSKKIVIGAVAAVAVVGIASAVWYFGFANKEEEPPKNAQNVSSTATAEPSGQPEESAAPAESGAPAQSGGASSGSAASGAAATEEPVKVTPTFMYFVTNDDLANEAVKSTLDALQAEYADRVNFDIKNVDEDATLLERFSFVEGNTPALIMLNTANDICDIKMKNSDQDALKASIEGALQ